MILRHSFPVPKRTFLVPKLPFPRSQTRFGNEGIVHRQDGRSSVARAHKFDAYLGLIKK